VDRTSKVDYEFEAEALADFKYQVKDNTTNKQSEKALVKEFA
jgi:hypothetical protein